MPDLSVIVTVYNLERYVGEAIESVLAQDFAGHVEIIVVDDCSTDGSAAIIRAYPQVRYVRTEQNSGVLLATLAGLHESVADVVFFLDGDDIWEPGKLSAAMLLFAADPPIGFVTHDLTFIGSDGEGLDRASRPEAEFAGVPANRAGEKVRVGILEFRDYVWLGSAFAIRKSVVDLAGFMTMAHSLPDPRNTYQDWPLAYWVAAQRHVAFGYVPRKLFRYRLHGLNHSGDAQTTERLLRNLVRAQNTNQAMLAIARMRELPRSTLRILEARIAFCDYRIDLAEGRRRRAVGKFLRSMTDLRRRGVLLKEVLRFIAVQSLGPERFLRLSSRRTRLRNLPVT